MKHTKYKIGVLTNVTGQSMQDLGGAAKKHEVDFEQIRFPSIPLSDLRNSDLIKQMSKYDVIYYRTGMRGAVVDEVAAILKDMKIPCVNCVAKHPFIHSKIRQALTADRYGIPQPKSFYVANFSYENAKAALGETFVIKANDGSKGDQMALIHSAEELLEFKKQKTKETYLYQEYIDNAEEYRVYTIGKRGVAVYKKTRGDSDFRANLHVGGGMTKAEPEMVDKLMAFGGRVADCFGADFSGVDVLMKDGQPLFLELNLQPGWESLDELTGISYCEEVIQYLLERAHKGRPFWKRFS